MSNKKFKVGQNIINEVDGSYGTIIRIFDNCDIYECAIEEFDNDEILTSTLVYGDYLTLCDNDDK